MKTLNRSVLLPYPGASLGRVTTWLIMLVIMYLATVVAAYGNSSSAIAVDRLQDVSNRNIDQIIQIHQEVRVQVLGFKHTCPMLKISHHVFVITMRAIK